MLVVTGSDMHKPEPAYGWTIANPESFTTEAVWKELINKRTSFLFDPEGLRLRMPSESMPIKSSILTSVFGLNDFIGTFYSKTNGQWDSQGGFCHPPRYTFSYLSVLVLLGYLLLLVIFLQLFNELLSEINSRYLIRDRRNII